MPRRPRLPLPYAFAPLMRLVFSRTRVPLVVTPYACRASGGPPVWPAYQPYARRSRRHRTTAVSLLSSPRRHRRSSTRPIKGALASPRASTEPPLPPSLRARPSTSAPSRPTSFSPSLGLAKLTQQALLVLQGHAKSCPQTGMRREDYDALNPTGPN
jgi:hypothetical protein